MLGTRDFDTTNSLKKQHGVTVDNVRFPIFMSHAAYKNFPSVVRIVYFHL